MKFYMSIFRKYFHKIQIQLQSDKNNGTLHEQQYTILITSRSVPLRTSNVSDKSCKQNQNIWFMFSNFFFKNRAVYEMWKNTVEPDWPQMTICSKRIACWITKITNTQSQYVVIIACLLQQWLQHAPQ
jgi:hypothetical protein